MYLLDSNILIYSAKPEFTFLRRLVTDEESVSAVSVTTLIEVLGFHRLTREDKVYFESCFALLQLIEVTGQIANKAVELRQQQKLSLGDAIIAATALVHEYELVTRNVADFEGVANLQLLNPFS